jgi:hypothetical protein
MYLIVQSLTWCRRIQFMPFPPQAPMPPKPQRQTMIVRKPLDPKLRHQDDITTNSGSISRSPLSLAVTRSKTSFALVCRYRPLLPSPSYPTFPIVPLVAGGNRHVSSLRTPFSPILWPIPVSTSFSRPRFGTDDRRPNKDYGHRALFRSGRSLVETRWSPLRSSR